MDTKLTLTKKILLPPLPGFELATFRSQVGALTNKLTQFLYNDNVNSLWSGPETQPLIKDITGNQPKLMLKGGVVTGEEHIPSTNYQPAPPPPPSNTHISVP